MAESYDIQLTDPLSSAFKVRAFTTNGTVFPTSAVLSSTAVSADTSLLIYGKGHPNFGERIAENMVHLLENFSGGTIPTNPVSGQLWFARYTIIQTSTGFYLWTDDDQDVNGGTWAEITPDVSGTAPSPIVDAGYWYDNTNVYYGVNNGTHPLSPIWLQRLHEDLLALGIPDPAVTKPRKQVKSFDGVSWNNINQTFASETSPTDPVEGDLWTDTTEDRLNFYANGGFIKLALDSEVLALAASFATDFVNVTGDTMTGTLDMSNSLITSVGAPVGGGDATNKTYVDGEISTAVGALTIPSNLEDLANVTAALTADTFLRVNGTGTAWVNDTLALADIGDVTSTAAQVNYLNTATSDIQTQLDGKLSLDGGTLNAAGKIFVDINLAPANNELITRSYLAQELVAGGADGVLNAATFTAGTMDLQLDTSVPTTYNVDLSHTHTKVDITDFAHAHLESDITDLQSYLLNITAEPLSDLSDVTLTTIASGEILKWNGSGWINNTLAEAGISEPGHTHTKSEITDFTHTHVKADITDFTHTHVKADITDFTHTHVKADITDFTHSHPSSEVTHTSTEPLFRDLSISSGNLDATLDTLVTDLHNRLSYYETFATREIFVAAASQTNFTLTEGLYKVGSNRLSVYVDGTKQYADERAHQGIFMESVGSQGTQDVDFTVAKVGGDSTGLTNDATTYTATITVDGGSAQPISVVGSAAQTFTTLVSEINTDLTGATASLPTSGAFDGNILITSDTKGTSSTVLIADTDLFSSLTNYSAINPVSDGLDFNISSTSPHGLIDGSYRLDIAVDGGGAQTMTIVVDGGNGDPALQKITIQDIIDEINSDITSAAATAVWSNKDTAIYVFSDIAGNLSEIDITDGTATAGTQTVDVGGAKTGGSATGLANDATVYTSSVVVDGGTSQPISIVGSAAQTYTNLLTEIDADLTGATSSLSGGNILITSSSTGTTSTIAISDTDLFTTLTDYVTINAAVQGIGALLLELSNVSVNQNLPVYNTGNVLPAASGPITQVTADRDYTETDDSYAQTGFGAVSKSIQFNAGLTASQVVEIISEPAYLNM